MNRLKPVLFISLALVVVAFASCGQDYRTDINPALRYYQAFMLEPTLNDSDRDFLWTNTWGSGVKMPDRMGEVMAGFSNSFDAMRIAGHATVPCDWGVDQSAGPGTLLPQLARCKHLAVETHLRVMWELQNGQEKEARDDLIAMFALGRNTAQDGTLIGLLVDFAIENVAITAVAQNFHSFAPETLQEIINGFDNAPPARTVAFAMLTGEKNLFVVWLEERIVQFQKESPGDDAAVMAKLRGLGDFLSDGSGTNRWNEMLNTAGDSTAILRVLKEEGEVAYQRASEILALPHGPFEPAAEKFEADLKKSGNAMVAASFPAISKAKTKEIRQQIAFAMLHAAIAYKTHGNDAFRAVKDPGNEGPFQSDRFMFNGVDRGFKLSSAYLWEGHPEIMIFVETDGPGFKIYGPHAGDPQSN